MLQKSSLRKSYVLILIKVDDFPLSIDLFGVNNDIPCMHCCAASVFNGQFMLNNPCVEPSSFTDEFIFHLWHFVDLFPGAADFTHTCDFGFEFFRRESVAEFECCFLVGILVIVVDEIFTNGARVISV